MDLPAVLAGLDGMVDAYDIAFLHRGSARRAFVPHLSVGSTRRLGWVRFSTWGRRAS